MALNNIARRSVRLMEELTTMPFRVAQELWDGNKDQSSSTTGRTINRSLSIMEQLTGMPFEVILNLLGPEKQTGPAHKQQNNHVQAQLRGEDGDFPNHFPPHSEH